MTAVRELTFDRFIIPAFAFKMSEGVFVSVDKSYDPTEDEVTDEVEDPIEGKVVDGEGTLDEEEPSDDAPTENKRRRKHCHHHNKEVIKGRLIVYRLKEEPSDESKEENNGGFVIDPGFTYPPKDESSDEEAESPVEDETENDPKDIIVSLPFQKYKTLESIMEALIEAGIVVAYTPYFRGEESSTSLIQVTERELTEDVTLFRKYFFSDDEIKKWISWYYLRVLDIPNVHLHDGIIGRLQRPSEKHLALWVSYFLVDRRRLYEAAAGAIGQTFTDGSDYTGSNVSDGIGTTTTTQIGSVFTITEDPTKGYFYEDFNRIGSDNVLGDRYSFWYRLQCWLRDQLEELFGDYSLRKDNVMPGYISLTRELDFRSYYDSYPFTLSPLSRGILSKTP